MGARPAAHEDPGLASRLQARVRPHQAFLVGQILAKIDFLEEAIGTLSDEIDRQVRPFEPGLERLMTIPGVKRRHAVTVVAETGRHDALRHRGPSVPLGRHVSGAQPTCGQTSLGPNTRGQPRSNQELRTKNEP